MSTTDDDILDCTQQQAVGVDPADVTPDTKKADSGKLAGQKRQRDNRDAILKFIEQLAAENGIDIADSTMRLKIDACHQVVLNMIHMVCVKDADESSLQLLLNTIHDKVSDCLGNLLRCRSADDIKKAIKAVFYDEKKPKRAKTMGAGGAGTKTRVPKANAVDPAIPDTAPTDEIKSTETIPTPMDD